MVAKDLISDLIPPLKSSDTGAVALNYMSEFHVSHLPIVEHKKFLGIISEENILDLNKPDKTLGQLRRSLDKNFVYQHQFIYDVIKAMAQSKLSLIAVIDEKENYQGVITLENIVHYLAQISSIIDPGGIIVLELNVKDYSLAEIARLIESNDAIILSVYISTNSNSTKMDVTLKINKTDIQSIIATFERFDYRVKAAYQESESYDDIKDHFDSLMNYLKM